MLCDAPFDPEEEYHRHNDRPESAGSRAPAPEPQSSSESDSDSDSEEQPATSANAPADAPDEQPTESDHATSETQNPDTEQTAEPNTEPDADPAAKPNKGEDDFDQFQKMVDEIVAAEAAKQTPAAQEAAEKHMEKAVETKKENKAMWNDFIGAVRKSMAAFEAADMQWVYKLEPGFHDCVQACRRLENELLREDTSNIEPSINPGPNSNARLCFYTTSLTLPFTSRNAAAQLMLCLPLNLFLALHARKWCSFYVPDLWLMFVLFFYFSM